MKIRVTKTFKYSEHGYDVTEYSAGREYDVSPACARTAVAEGLASEIGVPGAPAAGNGGRIEFTKLNKEQLTEICVERGVTIPEGATKKEIIALLEAPNGSAQ